MHQKKSLRGTAYRGLASRIGDHHILKGLLTYLQTSDIQRAHDERNGLRTENNII